MLFLFGFRISYLINLYHNLTIRVFICILYVPFEHYERKALVKSDRERTHNGPRERAPGVREKECSCSQMEHIRSLGKMKKLLG